jgi:hypothetical protein
MQPITRARWIIQRIRRTFHERDRLAGVDVELEEAMEQVAAGSRAQAFRNIHFGPAETLRIAQRAGSAHRPVRDDPACGVDGQA